MTADQLLDLIIYISVGIVFLAIIISAMIYNPNYSIKEILKKPWLIFDLIKHSANELDKKFDEVQEIIEQGKQAAEEVKEIIDETKNEIKEIVEEINNTIENFDKEEKDDSPTNNE